MSNRKDNVSGRQAVDGQSNETVVPPFDPRQRAREIENAASRETALPPSGVEKTPGLEWTSRKMYSSYLESDFPKALGLAEEVLTSEPGHAIAQLVANRCRERLLPVTPSMARTLSPTTLIRRRWAELEGRSDLDRYTTDLLGHIRGETDAATILALSNLQPPRTLDSLCKLLDAGLIEIVTDRTDLSRGC